jgi:hypothetical protein
MAEEKRRQEEQELRRLAREQARSKLKETNIATLQAEAKFATSKKNLSVAEDNLAKRKHGADIAEKHLREAQANLAKAFSELEIAQEMHTQANADVNDALRGVDGARLREAEAEQAWAAFSDDASSTWSKKDEDEAREEEAQRLQESIRKMQEMRREEEVEKARRRMAEMNAREHEEQRHKPSSARRSHSPQAQATSERKETDRTGETERERQKSEETQRQARAEQDRRNQEAEERKEAWAKATAREEERCKLRDQTRWPRASYSWLGLGSANKWSKNDALGRFEFICEEFDKITFSETQPLTVGSVPWPVLTAPDDIVPENIEWSAVEAFFEAVRDLMSTTKYKTSVEKCHRRFHPDKWHRRLNTVQNEQLRELLGKGVIAVSQSLTPLWQRSRSML